MKRGPGQHAVDRGVSAWKGRRANFVAALEKVLKPRAILLRNDASMRAMENLPSYVETALGEVPARSA